MGIKKTNITIGPVKKYSVDEPEYINAEDRLTGNITSANELGSSQINDYLNLTSGTIFNKNLQSDDSWNKQINEADFVDANEFEPLQGNAHLQGSKQYKVNGKDDTKSSTMAFAEKATDLDYSLAQGKKELTKIDEKEWLATPHASAKNGDSYTTKESDDFAITLGGNKIQDAQGNEIAERFKDSQLAGLGMGSVQSLAADFGSMNFWGNHENGKFSDIVDLKSKKYKNIHPHAMNGIYSTVNNLVGIAGAMYVGSLGKSEASNLIDDTLTSFVGGLNIAGMVEQAGGLSERMPTGEEIANLIAATYLTIQSSKPGTYIKDRGAQFNFITGDNYNGLEAKDGKSKNSVLSKVGGVVNKASNFMSKLNVSNAIKQIAGSGQAAVDASSDKDRLIHHYARADSDSGPYAEIQSLYYGNAPSALENRSVSKQEGSVHIISVAPPGQNLRTNGKAYTAYTESNFRDGVKYRAEVFNRVNKVFRQIGSLYVEPFYGKRGSLSCFEIPFEFNPVINEGGQIAEYQKEEIFGRLNSLRSYIRSDSSEVTIETTYIATSPNGEIDEENDDWLNGWMTDWTPSKLQQIERQLRALTLPYIGRENSEFVRPPTVRIKMHTRQASLAGDQSKTQEASNIEYVGDLFKYPNADGLIVTNTIDQITREKRYVVTNVSFSPINENWGNNYINEYIAKHNSMYKVDPDFRGWDADGNNVKDDLNYDWQGYRRYGFKVNITLAETTRNFLDVLPNYWDYVGGLKLQGTATYTPRYEANEVNENTSEVPFNSKFLLKKIADKYNNLEDYDKDGDGSKLGLESKGTANIFAFFYNKGNRIEKATKE